MRADLPTGTVTFLFTDIEGSTRLLPRLSLARGELRRAGALWGALEAEHERSRSRVWEQRRMQRAGPLLTEQDPSFLAAVEHGRDLDLWDAVAIALRELDLPQTVP